MGSNSEIEGLAAHRYLRGARAALVATHQPGQGRVKFALGTGQDRVTVDVTLATLHSAERGTVQVSGQAIVRQAPELLTDAPPGRA